MGSPRKRIGFLHRTQVQEIIDQLCIEENLSQSKVVGILVEEALAARGIFDPTQGQDFEANPNWKAQARSLMKKDSTEIKKPSFTKSGESSASDAELMEQFKEFQAFKAMMANQ